MGKTAPDYAKATSGMGASEPAGASAKVGVYRGETLRIFSIANI
jgi:hypothetical protein